MPVTRNTIRTLLAMVLLLAAGALLTLIPYPSLKTNDLAYRSLCPFAPWSTLALLLLAGIVFAIRKYLSNESPRS